MQDASRLEKFFHDFPIYAELYSALEIRHSTSSARVDSIRERGLLVSSGLLPLEVSQFLEACFEKYGTGHPADRQRLNTHLLGRKVDGHENDSRGVYLTVLGRGESIGDPIAFYHMPERAMLVLRALDELAHLDFVDARDKTKAAHLFKHLGAEYLASDAQVAIIQLDPFAPEILEAVMDDSVTTKLREVLESPADFGSLAQGSMQETVFRLRHARSEELRITSDISPDAIKNVKFQNVDTDQLRRFCTSGSYLFRSQGTETGMQRS